MGYQRITVERPARPQSEGQDQPENGSPVPDPEQRRTVRVALGRDPDEYLREEVLPDAPDAWLDHTSIRIGYEISPVLFFQMTLDTRFVSLAEVAERRSGQARRTGDGLSRVLRGADLHMVDSADELPLAEKDSRQLTPCTGGDLVANATGWRALPSELGDAVTSLSVLRARGPYSRALCEWLNSAENIEFLSGGRRYPPEDLPVPIDLISDGALDAVLKDLHQNRRAVVTAVTGLSSNVFTEAKQSADHFIERARSIAVRAVLAADAVSSAVDPVWQAELTFPFHIAALARSYRFGGPAAKRMEALLKLGEGVARTVGILTLSESVEHGRLSGELGKLFQSGATFGTWTTLLGRFAQDPTQPRMRELGELKSSTRLVELLRKIKNVRNDSSHAHGLRATHELEDAANTLEPLVVSTLTTANWLSTIQLDYVERCEYLDDSSYLLIGQRLRGSHPEWEPFEQPSTYPLRPERLYTGTDSTTDAGQPVDLSPLATVLVCDICHTRELFLINQANGEDIMLRSLKDHSVVLTQPFAP